MAVYIDHRSSAPNTECILVTGALYAEFPFAPSQLDMPRWFAIRTSARWELRASSELSRRGIETYLPISRVKRRWSDRVKIMDQPLFPGYLFGRFPVAERIRVLEAPGVRQIVGIGNTPASIGESEIDNLRTLVSAHPLLVPWPYLHAGQRIRINRGPLAGVEGFVVRAEKSALRIVVSVDLLQRSVAAEIDRDCIGAIE
jgi:transcription antitermination factor NusG